MRSTKPSQTWVTAAVYIAVVLCISRRIANAEPKCRHRITRNVVLERKVYHYTVVYNISEAQTNVQSCFEMIEDLTNDNIDGLTFRYKIDNEPIERTGHYILDSNGAAEFVCDATPWDPLPTYYEEEPSGVIVYYVCEDNRESILILYQTNLDLSAAADEEAKRLTDRPLDYKIDWSDC